MPIQKENSLFKETLLQKNPQAADNAVNKQTSAAQNTLLCLHFIIRQRLKIRESPVGSRNFHSVLLC